MRPLARLVNERPEVRQSGIGLRVPGTADAAGRRRRGAVGLAV